MVHGDLNLCEPSDSAFLLDSRLEAKCKESQLANFKLWKKALEPMAFLDSQAHCHYHRETNSTSPIDRCYVTAPAYVLQLLFKSSSTIMSPVKMTGLGLSDHSPHCISLGAFQPSPQKSQTIPNWVCKSPRWQELHSIYAAEADLNSLAPIPRLQLHKEIIGHISHIVRW